MNEEEDCDDLPLITVNTSCNNLSTFAMPSAEQLAEQRARDLECEHKLEKLRQRARASEHMTLGPSDAGASEGELTLAAAVTALDVRAERPRAEQAASAAELWAALAPHLPPHAAALQSCLSAPAPQVRAVLSRAVSAVAGSLAAPSAPTSWPDDELQCAAALLSVGVLARESRCRRVAARALHALLDGHASPDQVFALADVLLAALPAPRARLLLSDALRSGAAAGADLAAAALTSATALQLLRAARGAATAAMDTGAGGDRCADTGARGDRCADTGARGDRNADAVINMGARAGLGTDTAAMDTGPCADRGADKAALDTRPCADKAALDTGPCADKAALYTGPCTDRGADTAALDTGACADRGADTAALDTGPCADRGADTATLDTGPCADRGADKAALDTGPCADRCADKAALYTGPCPDRGADTAALDTGACADRGADTAALDTGPCADRGADKAALDTGPCADRGADKAALDTGPCADRGADKAALDTGALDSVARAAGAWRSCDAPSRYVCVQLAGRLLAAAHGCATPAAAVRERLLAHLALPPAADGAHRTDRLKAMVGVSTLKLLFSAKNSVSGQARPKQDIAK